MTDTKKALDVWLRWDEGARHDPVTDQDYLATYEANTFSNGDGTFRVEWYHNEVGLVSTRSGFLTHDDACAWLESEGFEDYSS